MEFFHSLYEKAGYRQRIYKILNPPVKGSLPRKRPCLFVGLPNPELAVSQKLFIKRAAPRMCIKHNIAAIFLQYPVEVPIHRTQIMYPDMHAIRGINQIKGFVHQFFQLHAVRTIVGNIQAPLLSNFSSIFNLFPGDIRGGNFCPKRLKAEHSHTVTAGWDTYFFTFQIRNIFFHHSRYCLWKSDIRILFQLPE